MRTPFFRDHASFRPPRRGPLLGKRVMVLLAPTEADARGVERIWRTFRPLGIMLSAVSECHGEVRGEDRRAIFPALLMVEARDQEADALVVAGGRGAQRMVEDQLARELIRRFSREGKLVAAFGEGQKVLAAAKVGGLVDDDPEALADAIAARLGHAAAPAAEEWPA